MKKIVRLTESDLVRLVKRVIMEEQNSEITITSFVLIPEIPDPSKVTTSDGKTYGGSAISTCGKPAGSRMDGKSNSDIPEGMTIYLNYSNDKDLVCTKGGCLLKDSNTNIRINRCK